MQKPIQSLEAKIEAGALSVRFDGGYWNVLAHGVKRVTAVIDLGGTPRHGRVEWINEWGLPKSETATLATPKRLA